MTCSAPPLATVIWTKGSGHHRLRSNEMVEPVAASGDARDSLPARRILTGGLVECGVLVHGCTSPLFGRPPRWPIHSARRPGIVLLDHMGGRGPLLGCRGPAC